MGKAETLNFGVGVGRIAQVDWRVRICVRFLMHELDLDNGQFGDLGEDCFQALCTKEGFSVNRSSRDRMGWDFIIEWPPQSQNSDLPSDKLDQTLSAMVQVKATHKGNTRIVCRLSSLQRLANRSLPTFIYVAVFDDRKELVEAYVVHVAGEFLAKLLKALRLADLRARPANMEKFSFSVSKWGQRIASTGIAFKETASAMIGPSMKNYEVGKREEYENIGYERGRIRIDGSFPNASRDDIVDGLIGLSDLDMNIELFSDIRFNLPAPIKSLKPGSARFKVLAPKAGDAKITFRHPNVEKPATFAAVTHSIPRGLSPADSIEFVFLNDIFRLDVNMIISGEASGQVRMNLIFQDERVLEAKKTVQEWEDFFRALEMLQYGVTSVDVALKGSGLKISSTFPRPMPGNPTGHHRTQRALCVALQEALTLAQAPHAKLGLADIYKRQRELEILHSLLHHPETIVLVEFFAPEPELCDSHESDALHFWVVPYGPFSLVHCSRFHIVGKKEGGEWIWRPEDMQQIDVTRQVVATGKSGQKFLDSYVLRMKRLTGVNLAYFTFVDEVKNSEIGLD